jgi:hypothetical protein
VLCDQQKMNDADESPVVMPLRPEAPDPLPPSDSYEAFVYRYRVADWFARLQELGIVKTIHNTRLGE